MDFLLSHQQTEEASIRVQPEAFHPPEIAYLSSDNGSYFLTAISVICVLSWVLENGDGNDR